MLFAIHCLDNPTTPSLRDDNYEAHREYLASRPVRILMAGPILDDQTQRRIGSMLIVESDDIAKVREFCSADPFAKAGVWKTVNIHEFVLAVGDFKVA